MTEQRPLNTSPLPVKLRVYDYLMLDEAGAFADYAKTELIEGEIFFMNAQHRPHSRIKTELAFRLRDALRAAGSPLELLIEVSVSAPPFSAPEPDLVITSEAEGEGLIPLSSVALIVEVADTTLASDLGRKAGLYAREGVPEYWVVDVRGRVLHQLWSPSSDCYDERRQVAFGEPMIAATLSYLEIATDGL